MSPKSDSRIGFETNACPKPYFSMHAQSKCSQEATTTSNPKSDPVLDFFIKKKSNLKSDLLRLEMVS